MNKLPSKKWALQDAKARFSELVDIALTKGPQVVTRRGVDTVAVISMEELQRLSKPSGPTLKDLLLNAPRDAEFARILGKRPKIKLPPPVALG